MKTKWLFPYRYRFIGWVIALPALLIGTANRYADFTFSVLSVKTILFSGFSASNNLTDELAGLGTILGLLLIAFSKEQIEDEMISQLRLEALQWSVYANYMVLAVAIITIYDGAFLDVMVYNMFTMLLVFIGRFRWLLYRHTSTLLTL